MIIVIADDVTGAAEMAGVALHNNLNVQFVTDVNDRLPGTDVLVIATDTRSFSCSEAIEAMKHIAGYLIYNKGITIFKKTDSVLRGHVTAELTTLAECLGYKYCLLLPQNPSKGRIISGGRYYIDNKPLEETSFCFDPEFPAKTSDVEGIAVGSVSMAADGEMMAGRINIGDATNKDELKKQVDKTTPGTLVAGAADTFSLLIKKLYATEKVPARATEEINNGKTLVICGSTQSKSLIDKPYFRRCKSVEEGMPADVFHGAPADGWLEHLKNAYKQNDATIIKIGHKATGGKEYATRLRATMSHAVTMLTGIERPALLVIEGGATAFAALKELQWNEFTVKKEITPGVVCLTYHDTDIILKPGSYPWGCMFE